MPAAILENFHCEQPCYGFLGLLKFLCFQTLPNLVMVNCFLIIFSLVWHPKDFAQIKITHGKNASNPSNRSAIVKSFSLYLTSRHQIRHDIQTIIGIVCIRYFRIFINKVNKESMGNLILSRRKTGGPKFCTGPIICTSSKFCLVLDLIIATLRWASCGTVPMCMLTLWQWTTCMNQCTAQQHPSDQKIILQLIHIHTCVKFEIPSKKQIESKILDFPLPFKPVIALNWGSNPLISVLCAYDLKPSTTIDLIYIVCFVQWQQYPCIST